MIKKTESPKDIRDKAKEDIARFFNSGLNDAEVDQQTMFTIDRLTLIGIIRDLMNYNP